MSETLVIIDYGSGNLRSVQKAFERAAQELGRALSCIVTDKPDLIAAADRVVLPGVGAFGACASGLRARDGVIEALEHAVLVNGRPFLGVCVGMQLLATRGLEFGKHDGLGWIAGTVKAIEPSDPALKTPHMGWSEVRAENHIQLFDGLSSASFYFAHSYHFEAENAQSVLAVTDYGGDVVAAIGRDNILGVQFHPEKSQTAGLKLISNMLNWTP